MSYSDGGHLSALSKKSNEIFLAVDERRQRRERILLPRSVLVLKKRSAAILSSVTSQTALAGSSPGEPGSAGLGRLETLVMQCLWQSDGALSVRDVSQRMNGPWAYTTLMTTLDRLFKKGLVGREPRGRAFLYTARVSRTELGAQALTQAVSRMGGGVDDPELALAALIDAIESHDPEWLDSLDRLVREKKRALRRSREEEGRS